MEREGMVENVRNVKKIEISLRLFQNGKSTHSIFLLFHCYINDESSIKLYFSHHEKLSNMMEKNDLQQNRTLNL